MAEEAPAEKPAEKPAEAPAAAPAEKPAEQPAAKPEAAPAEKPAEKPAEAAQPSGGSSKPFLLSLIGGILILVTGIIVAALGTLLAAIASMIPMMGMEVLMAAGAMMYIPLILGIVVIVGAVLMRNPAQAKMGSILVLICSIVSLVTIVGSGFFIGAILGIIGGALGLKK